jgi:hypothetical protein
VALPSPAETEIVIVTSAKIVSIVHHRFENTEKNKNNKGLRFLELRRKIDPVLLPIARFLLVPHLISLIWIGFWSILRHMFLLNIFPRFQFSSPSIQFNYAFFIITFSLILFILLSLGVQVAYA